MLHICSALWDTNSQSFHFSRCYNEAWVEKLYRGFARNLTVPFQFVCFTDRPREFSEPIRQEPLTSSRPIGYGAFTEPYKLGEPMILVGLDTVITGKLDHLAEYCLTGKHLAVPRDPYDERKVCNGVALVPRGYGCVYEAWRGQNDMEWIRIRTDTVLIDDLFPGQVRSYKVHVQKKELGDARIVYFHGTPKMHEIDDGRILAHWK